MAFLFFWIEPVSLEVSVLGYKEGDVILPCTYSGPHVNNPSPDDYMPVLWRYEGNKVVHDVIKGKSVLSEQDQQFKGRTSIFPEELQKGNFSLRLTNLREDDSGEFTCTVHLGTDQVDQAVKLRIEAEKPTEPISPEFKEQFRNRSVETCPENRIFLLILLLACVLPLV